MPTHRYRLQCRKFENSGFLVSLETNDSEHAIAPSVKMNPQSEVGAKSAVARCTPNASQPVSKRLKRHPAMQKDYIHSCSYFKELEAKVQAIAQRFCDSSRHSQTEIELPELKSKSMAYAEMTRMQKIETWKRDVSVMEEYCKQSETEFLSSWNVYRADYNGD
jgi:hypothetical protein